MHYGTIKKYDVANGPGVRVSLFVSGCTHHCKGCFNPETWNFDYGKSFDQNAMNEILEALKPAHIKGFTLLGGEPFEHENQIGLLPLLRSIKETYPQKDIWCFSGYLFDQDMLDQMAKKWPETLEMLSYIDILVDGEFMIDKKDITLRFRGSSNQRIIKVQESLQSNKVVLWEGM